MKKDNERIVSLMNDFLKPVRVEKEARLAKSAAGPVVATKEKDGDEDKGVQGAAGKEDTKDMEKGLGNAQAAASASQPVAADSKNNVGEVNADEAVDKQEIGLSETSEPAKDNAVNGKEEHIDMINKKAHLRNQYLANRILEVMEKESAEAQAKEAEPKTTLEKLAALKPAQAEPKTTLEKLAALRQSKEAGMDKEAAELFAAGRAQRVSDITELVGIGMTEKQANYLLDKVAEETPEAILPPDAVPDEAVEEAEETAAVQELLEAGVPPEEILEAIGVTPEEVIAALEAEGIDPTQLMGEGEALPMEGGAPEGMPMEGMPMEGGAPEGGMGGEEEQAIAELLEAGVPEEEIAAALQG